MRIREIRIDHWRHFQNIHLKLDNDAPLVCVVGANGTGKSHMLELIASCAHELGLASGVENARGSVFADEHSVSLTFYLAPGVSSAVDVDLASNPQFASWDRTLQIISSRTGDNHHKTMTAGGVAPEHSSSFASRVINRIQASESVFFLALDADRAYPKKTINVNQMAEAYEIDWAGAEYTKNRSFRPTATLYDEWLKYFLAQENQAGSRLMQGIRRAAKTGATPPTFSDHFATFAASVQKVLPHMTFTGVDTKQRTLLFDTTGLELSFNQLSGGEREIAFQIGQIDRFGLRQGLFLLDEPELHLNPDLIRQWVSYLTGTVEDGQIWLATHSLEAVEAAGPTATFVLERNETTRKVDSLARLDSRPVLAALSRSVGTPAFSISQLTFVYVEGEERLGERERFRRLAGLPDNVRFMERGSCNEVIRRLADVKSLAKESGSGIRIGAIIDKDFRGPRQLAEFKGVQGLHVLPVLECENLFLNPATLQLLAVQNGKIGLSPEDLIRAASDSRAGAWVFQHAMATPNASDFPAMNAPCKEYAKTLKWDELQLDPTGKCAAIASRSGFSTDDQKKLTAILEISLRAYEKSRTTPELWKSCEGKQVLAEIAGKLGFAGSDTLIQASTAAWERDDRTLPQEVSELRAFVAGL